MKAIVSEQYGPPEALQFKEVEKPVPNDSQVLVKVRAASANPLDLQIYGGLARLWSGLRKPRDPRLGRDIAGEVEAAGKSVTRFRPGDEVFGVCAGGFAEYACAHENGLAMKPANCSFEEAAAAPVAGATALQGLREKGQIRPGQKVLIYGASGGVGTFAVQVARSFAAEVTAVCSPRNIDLARSLGADQVLDYTREDFTQNGQRYDLILAVNGYRSIFDYLRCLSPTGVCVVAGGSGARAQFFQALLLGPWISKLGRKKIGVFIAQINPAVLEDLRGLMETGKVKPAIDRRFPLQDTPAALRYLNEGHAQGKIVITVS